MAVCRKKKNRQPSTDEFLGQHALPWNIAWIELLSHETLKMRAKKEREPTMRREWRNDCNGKTLGQRHLREEEGVAAERAGPHTREQKKRFWEKRKARSASKHAPRCKAEEITRAQNQGETGQRKNIPKAAEPTNKKKGQLIIEKGFGDRNRMSTAAKEASCWALHLGRKTGSSWVAKVVRLNALEDKKKKILKTGRGGEPRIARGTQERSCGW